MEVLCICNNCRRMYQYNAADGDGFGTKNLLDHVRLCKGADCSGQLKLVQSMRHTPRVSKPDIATLKQKKVEFCATGYHAFLSVENSNFKSVLQACVNLGTKYSKFDKFEILAGRKAISRETQNLAAKTTEMIKDRLKQTIEDSAVALSTDMYTDCLCHRLHTILETMWRKTKTANLDAAAYKTAIADLCRYVKQASGVQEQLPTSLKHGGDTRPWTSMYRRAKSVATSYDACHLLLCVCVMDCDSDTERE